MNSLVEAPLPEFFRDERAEAVAARVIPNLTDVADVAALSVKELGVSYANRAVLKGVTIDIAAGHITALIGPSGCGKTSFLSCLNRMIDLVPGSTVSGRVLLHGEDLYGEGVVPLMLRRRVGMVFQRPNPFPLSIRKNLEMPLREIGVRSRSELEGRVERALRDVGLWKEVAGQLNKSALALSGGQQQRLCIARAIALEPSTLLLDEPCSALDPISSGAVEDLIVQLRGRYTVVVVTHNLAQARRIADEVALFWVQDGCGALIESGNAHKVFTAPQHCLTCEYICGMRG
jgi:phosphate transport system ATP-binding protein